MDAAARLQLIRQRVKRHAIDATPKPLGAFRSSHPDQCPVPRKKGYVKVYRPRNVPPQFGLLLAPEHRRNDWIKSPDLPPDRSPLKRNTGPHPLTKISLRLPAKLPVLVSR